MKARAQVTKGQMAMLRLAAVHDAVVCSGDGAERLGMPSGSARVAFVSLAEHPRARVACNTLVTLGLLDEVPERLRAWVRRPDGAEWQASTYTITADGREALLPSLTPAQARALVELSMGPVCLPPRLVGEATQKALVRLGLAEDAAGVGCPGGLRLTRAGRLALKVSDS